MHRITRGVVFVFFVVVATTTWSASPWYAKPTGSGINCTDVNECSLNTCIQTAKYGGECILREGTYEVTTQITISDSECTEQDPCIIRAENEEMQTFLHLPSTFTGANSSMLFLSNNEPWWSVNFIQVQSDARFTIFYPFGSDHFSMEGTGVIWHSESDKCVDGENDEEACPNGVTDCPDGTCTSMAVGGTLVQTEESNYLTVKRWNSDHYPPCLDGCHPVGYDPINCGPMSTCEIKFAVTPGDCDFEAATGASSAILIQRSHDAVIEAGYNAHSRQGTQVENSSHIRFRKNMCKNVNNHSCIWGTDVEDVLVENNFVVQDRDEACANNLNVAAIADWYCGDNIVIRNNTQDGNDMRFAQAVQLFLPNSTNNNDCVDDGGPNVGYDFANLQVYNNIIQGINNQAGMYGCMSLDGPFEEGTNWTGDYNFLSGCFTDNARVGFQPGGVCDTPSYCDFGEWQGYDADGDGAEEEAHGTDTPADLPYVGDDVWWPISDTDNQVNFMESGTCSGPSGHLVNCDVDGDCTDGRCLYCPYDDIVGLLREGEFCTAGAWEWNQYMSAERPEDELSYYVAPNGAYIGPKE